MSSTGSGPLSEAGPLGAGREPERVVAGRYVLGQSLGRGGMGIVWRARDTLLQRDVAVKEVELRASSTDDEDELRARVLREARAAARLHQPGAVTVFDVVEEAGRPYIVMELVDAPTLGELVAEHGPMAPMDAAQIGLELLEPLEAAHAHGVVHRDVKPSNVMVLAASGRRAKLTDFGVAAIADDPRNTRSGLRMGSPAFVSPEQAMDADVGPPSDLWSLGALLYYAVEGVVPFPGDDPLAIVTAIVSDGPRPPERAGPLAPVLLALLTKDPARRPTPAQARRMLTSVLRGAPIDVLGPFDPGDGDPIALPTASATLDGGLSQSDEADEPLLLPRIGSRSIGTGGSETSGLAPGPPLRATAEPTARPAAGPAAGPAARPAARPAAGSTSRPSRGRGLASRRPLLALMALSLVVLGGLALRLGSSDDDTQVEAGRVGSSGTTAGEPPSGTTPASALPPTTGATGATGPTGTARAPSTTQPATTATQTTATQTTATQTTATQTTATQTTTRAAGTVPGARLPGAPASWTVYADPIGRYQVAHPPGWQVRNEGTLTDFRDPRTGTYVRINWTDDPRPALAAWQEFEPVFEREHRGYRRLRMEQVDYRGYDAAEWEFNYSAEQGIVRGVNFSFDTGGRAYVVNAAAWDYRWTEAQRDYERFKASFTLTR